MRRYLTNNSSPLVRQKTDESAESFGGKGGGYNNRKLLPAPPIPTFPHKGGKVYFFKDFVRAKRLLRRTDRPPYGPYGTAAPSARPALVQAAVRRSTNRRLCFVCCLVMTTFLVVFSLSRIPLFAEDPPPPPPSTEKKASPAKEAAPPASKTEVPGMPTENKLTFRDPFQSNLPSGGGPALPGETPVEITANLEGISISGAGSLALINGELYHEGETKGGIQVTQIKKKEVDIMVNGLSRTLRMIPPPVGPPDRSLSASGGTTGGGMIPVLRASTSPFDKVKKEEVSQTVEKETPAEDQMKETSEEGSLEKEKTYV